MKGIAYAGALEALEKLQLNKQPVMPQIKRVAGTSAGAITAALVALGASAKDVAQIVGGTDFRAFLDDSFGIVRDTKRLIQDFGWYKGDAFANWMKKQVLVLGGDPNLTFLQLSERAKLDPVRYRELYVVGTGLSMQMPVVFSAENGAEYPIWYAVRVSMSIPLFFAAVKDTKGYQVLVDGGVTWNYPLDLFDEVKYLSKPRDKKTFVVPKYPTTYDDNHLYNKETLGFRVDTKDEIRAEKEAWKLPPKQIDDFFDYLKALVGYMHEMANKAHLHQNDWHRTVFIDAGGIRTTQFSLSGQQVDMLIQNGRDGVKKYFDWFNDEEADPSPINRV